jgi:hypothetical protein
MRTNTIIKSFVFEEKNRDKITLGSNVRLNPETNRLELKLTSGGYSTSANLYAKTWITNPTSVKKWTGFDLYDKPNKDYDGSDLTSVGFRLGNGTNEYYWNGSSWEINTSNWNTEIEIVANIDTFTVTDKKIQIIINLVTTTATLTPSISEIKISYDSDIDFQDNLIFYSLVPKLKEEVRPISDYIIELSSDSSTIDLNSFPFDTPYDITGIDSVFNYTNDSDLLIDLYQSYDSGTKIITLSSSILTGEKVFIKFYYRPLIAVSTDREYLEVDKVPALRITSIETVKNKTASSQFFIRDKSAETAKLLKNIKLKDVEITLICLSGTSKNQQRLLDEARRFFENNTKINCTGLDEDYDIVLREENRLQTTQIDLDTYSSTFRFRIINVMFSQKQEENLYIVKRFVMSGDVNATI